MNTEPSVEQCLKELRELFPHTQIVIGIRVSEITGDAWFFIDVGPNDSILIAVSHPSLNSCLKEVRKWKATQ